MERLTDKMLTEACNDPWDYCGLDAHCTRHCTQPTPCKIPALVHRLAKIENILGDNYDLDRLRELVEADNDGRCVVLPFLPPKVMWSCSKRQPKPAKSFYASEIGILADMKAGCVFGETPEEAEAALTNKENHVKK